MFNRKVLLFILLIASTIVEAQKANILIEYDYHYIVVDARAYLLGNDSQSYFLFSKSRDDTYEKLLENNFLGLNRYHVFNYDFESGFSYQKPTLNREVNGLKAKLTKDEFDLDWKIGTDKRTILNYNCTLATTTFRGNKFKVWFTTEIESNIFPWKLKGLPGVILAFEDDYGLLKGEAMSVIINKEIDLPKKTVALFEENKKEAISYKAFILIENKLLKDMMSEKVSQLPVGTKYKLPELRQMQVEKTFEWETEPAKP